MSSPELLNDDLVSNVDRVRRRLIGELLSLQQPGGYWTGELSTSALSTATTVVAFEMLTRNGVSESNGRPLGPLIDGGLRWLIDNVNDDGGWGDTTKSVSNISTTTLVRAALALCDERSCSDWLAVIERADRWIADATVGHASLSAAIVARYGKDKTFSVPILMQCALAGLVDWNDIPALPFELAVLPHRFYAAVKLPVVSYALPALIAIGQLLHAKSPTWFFPLRWGRAWAIGRTLDKLAQLQPANGGFLEAAPLTGFVTMALAANGRADHVVARRGAAFLVDSVRPDGSWPIDTNLSTWVTTLVVNALGDSARDELPDPEATLAWLLDQQHTAVHPFTNAAPGGWAWTPLPGGVPDADDTAGAVRALMYLRPPDDQTLASRVDSAATDGLRWLASLQNRDGGAPTFCRGWGTLPFDRSSCDITAHAIAAARAVAAKAENGSAVAEEWLTESESRSTWTGREVKEPRARGLIRYLVKQRASDHAWRPLWFGNQSLATEENPVYGTGRVLMAMAGREDSCFADFPSSRTYAEESVAYLIAQQNEDGGFGGGSGTPSTVEETAVALEALLCRGDVDEAILANGLRYLVGAIDRGEHRDAQPIGFYFAKLWYFEMLYPYAFALGALQTAVERFRRVCSANLSE